MINCKYKKNLTNFQIKRTSFVKKLLRWKELNLRLLGYESSVLPLNYIAICGFGRIRTLTKKAVTSRAIRYTTKPIVIRPGLEPEQTESKSVMLTITSSDNKSGSDRTRTYELE